MRAQACSQPPWLWDAHVHIPETVLFQDLDGEVVLLNLSSGFYFGLDAVGSRMWHLLQQYSRLDDVLTQLCQEFEVEESRGRADLEEFVSTLTSHHLLELSPPDQSSARE